MPREVTYWPVFLFNAGIVGDFKLLGIFTSEKEAQSYADEVNKGIPPDKPKAVTGEFTLQGIESHIIQYWMRASFPQELLSDSLKMLYDKNGIFPVAVAKTGGAAA